MNLNIIELSNPLKNVRLAAGEGASQSVNNTFPAPCLCGSRYAAPATANEQQTEQKTERDHSVALFAALGS